MAIGQITGIGKQDGASPTPSTAKLYQVVINLTMYDNNNYDFSFYSSTKVENYNDLYNKISGAPWEIHTNANSNTSCTNGKLRISGTSIQCICYRNGTYTQDNITSSSTGITYTNKEL